MGRSRKHDRHLPQGIYPVGRKWRQRIYVDGKPGWRYFDKLKDALEAAAEAASLRSGAIGTLGKGIRRYRKEILPKELSQETQRTERPRLDRLERVMGHLDGDDLTRQMVYQYMDNRPLVAGNREVARLGAVYQYFIKWGYATENPCLHLKRDAEPARHRYVTDEELETTLAVLLDRAFHGGSNGRGAHMMAVVWSVLSLEYLTGRRGSTIRDIRRADLRQDGLLVRETKISRRNSRGDVIKEPKEIIFPWTDALRLTVENIKRLCRSKTASLWLIPNSKGSKVTTGSFNQAWQQARPWIAAAGVDPFQPRDIRAKHKTDFAGADLGHADQRTTDKHYQRKPIVVLPLK